MARGAFSRNTSPRADCSPMPTHRRVTFALVCAAFWASASYANYSYSEYDNTRTVEVSGTLVEFEWQNPRIHFRVRSLKEGRAITWDVEGHSLSFLRRTNVTPKLLRVGDRVTIAGWPSRASRVRLFAQNLLTADGRELVLDPRTKPRWETEAIGLETTWTGEGSASEASRGIFRVWSSKVDDPDATPLSLWRTQYPLTESAKRTVAKWDPLRDRVARDCAPKGMPTIMEQPYPIEFVKRGNTILLRLEEYDTVRVIEMFAGEQVSRARATLLGRSTGKWDGASLVVKTTGISWPFIDSNGVPQSRSSRLVERFTPSPDDTRLQYTLTITDPQIFTAPVVLKREWVARPGERVGKYNCVPRYSARK
jgi:hypothetical protein